MHNCSRRRFCYFYAEDGGLRATDEEDRESILLYFLGVIDILTPYNFKKKTEHLVKSLTQDKVQKYLDSKLATLAAYLYKFLLAYNIICACERVWRTLPSIYEGCC